MGELIGMEVETDGYSLTVVLDPVSFLAYCVVKGALVSQW